LPSPSLLSPFSPVLPPNTTLHLSPPPHLSSPLEKPPRRPAAAGSATACCSFYCVLRPTATRSCAYLPLIT
jgi:hypothetical protein